MAEVALDADILQRIARYRRRRKARLLLLFAPVLLETVALAIVPIVWVFLHSGPFFTGLEAGTGADWVAWSVFVGLAVIPLAFLLAAWTERLPVAKEPAPAISHYIDAANSLSIGAGVPAPEVVALSIPTVNALAFRSGKKWSIGITEAALDAGLTRQQVEALTAREPALFPPKASYPDYLFVSRVKVDIRLANLAAIEREGPGSGTTGGATSP